MVKQRSSLNQADISLLKKTFATKDDLKNFATKDDLKSIKIDLKTLKKDAKKIKKDTKYTVDFLDKNMIKLHKRTERIEEHLDLPPVPELEFI